MLVCGMEAPQLMQNFSAGRDTGVTAAAGGVICGAAGVVKATSLLYHSVFSTIKLTYSEACFPPLSCRLIHSITDASAANVMLKAAAPLLAPPTCLYVVMVAQV